jgi:hypothetical protein
MTVYNDSGAVDQEAFAEPRESERFQNVARQKRAGSIPLALDDPAAAQFRFIPGPPHRVRHFTALHRVWQRLPAFDPCPGRDPLRTLCCGRSRQGLQQQTKDRRSTAAGRVTPLPRDQGEELHLPVVPGGRHLCHEPVPFHVWVGRVHGHWGHPGAVTANSRHVESLVAFDIWLAFVGISCFVGNMLGKPIGPAPVSVADDERAWIRVDG